MKISRLCNIYIYISAGLCIYILSSDSEHTNTSERGWNSDFERAGGFERSQRHAEA